MFFLRRSESAVAGLVDFGSGCHSIESDIEGGEWVHLLNDFHHILDHPSIDLLDAKGIKFVLEEALVIAKTAVDHAIEIKIEVVDLGDLPVFVGQIDPDLGVATS